MLLEMGLLLPAGAGALLGYAVRGRSSQLFGPNLWRGPGDKRQVALTFDDGPSETTLQVLDLLDHYCVPATFFQCGRNVLRLPGVAREVHERGHEIGNHTFSHPRLAGCSQTRIREEIATTQQVISDAAGVEPRLFRAPYGLRWFGLRQVLHEYGLLGVMWTVIGYDWEWEAQEIADYVTSQASNGAIFCLHDGDRTAARVDRRNTVRAIAGIIPKLQRAGYAFVTAGDMAGSLASFTRNAQARPASAASGKVVL
jgi:peptidoglycan/xylan/chitin deacetylase (PgdA/CDA1 family)